MPRHRLTSHHRVHVTLNHWIMASGKDERRPLHYQSKSPQPTNGSAKSMTVARKFYLRRCGKSADDAGLSNRIDGI